MGTFKFTSKNKKHKATVSITHDSVTVGTWNPGNLKMPVVTRSNNQGKHGLSFEFSLLAMNGKSTKSIESYKATFGKKSKKATVRRTKTSSNARAAFVAVAATGKTSVDLAVRYAGKNHDIGSVKWACKPTFSEASSSAVDLLSLPDYDYAYWTDITASVKVSNVVAPYTVRLSVAGQKSDVTYKSGSSTTRSDTFHRVPAGNQQVTVTVTDKYGYVTKSNVGGKLLVSAVDTPTVDTHVIRCDTNGVRKEDGTIARLDLGWTFPTMDGYVRRREISVDCFTLGGDYLFTQTWTNVKDDGTLDDTLLPLQSDENLAYKVEMDGGFSIDTSFVFQVTATDYGVVDGTDDHVPIPIAQHTTMPMAQYMIDLHPSGRSIGLGTFAPDPTGHDNGILKIGYDLVLMNDYTIEREVFAGTADKNSSNGKVTVTFTRLT